MCRLSALLFTLMLHPLRVFAQDATPAAFPQIPDPSECQIATRDAKDLAAMEGGPPVGSNAARPQPTPLPVWSGGAPASADTVARNEATVNERAACAAASGATTPPSG